MATTRSMRLIVVSGFLGSGKTSLVLDLARSLVQERGCRVAVVENEIGDQGVDDRLITASGIPVRQLYAGCVCCELKGDLHGTLCALVAEQDPDAVIVEPSGAAGASVGDPALALGVPGCEPPELVAIFDASRMRLLEGLNPWLIEEALALARTVVLSKADAVAPELLAEARARLAALRPDKPCQPLDLRQEGAGAAVLAALDLLRDRSDEALPAGRPAHPRGLPAAVARQLRISGGAAELDARISALLETLAAGLPAPAGGVPGHLKAFLDAGSAGWRSFSLTALAQGVHRRGAVAGQVAEGQLTVNAIVAGMPRGDLERMVDAAMVPFGMRRRLL